MCHHFLTEKIYSQLQSVWVFHTKQLSAYQLSTSSVLSCVEKPGVGYLHYCYLFIVRAPALTHALLTITMVTTET